MKDIQDAIQKEHENMLKILTFGIEKLQNARYSEDFEEVKTELLYKLKVEMARVEGYITGKISAAQKEPQSIKL